MREAYQHGLYGTPKRMLDRQWSVERILPAAQRQKIYDMGAATRQAQQTLSYEVAAGSPEVKDNIAQTDAGLITESEPGFASANKKDSFSADYRDNLTSIANNHTIKMQRGFMCFPENDPLLENSRKVIPKEGFFDIAMHGSPTAVAFGTEDANMSPRLLASVIRHHPDYHGENIRLLSCNTGLKIGDNYCFAEELANALGVIVEAPDMEVYIYPNGNIEVGLANEGKMITYKPNERRRIK